MQPVGASGTTFEVCSRARTLSSSIRCEPVRRSIVNQFKVLSFTVNQLLCALKCKLQPPLGCLSSPCCELIGLARVIGSPVPVHRVLVVPCR
eukprot:5305740-Alexandrium_andersonii.AAC.1